MNYTGSLTYPDNLYLAAKLSNHGAYRATKWIWILVPPIIIALGTFGNVMTLVVLRCLTRTTTNLFLGALAIADLLLLYVGLLTEWLDVMFEFSFKNAHTVTCKLGNFFWNSLGVLSAWLIVGITVHRAMGVLWPSRVDIVCVGRRPLLFILGTVVFSVTLNSHMLYGAGLEMLPNTSTLECGALGNEVYVEFVKFVWPWIDMLFFSLLPFLILVISNSVLVWKVMEYKSNRQCNGAQCGQSKHCQNVLSSVTMTVIVISITFLILTLPISLCYLVWMYITFPRYQSDMAVRAFVMLMYSLAMLLWYANSAANFYIYCLTGTQFKSKFKKIWHRRKKRVPR